MMSDVNGEANDLMYLKNHSLIKSGLDFTVGFNLGDISLTSNP
jgi:hypothetical protein